MIQFRELIFISTGRFIEVVIESYGYAQVPVRGGLTTRGEMGLCCLFSPTFLMKKLVYYQFYRVNVTHTYI